MAFDAVGKFVEAKSLGLDASGSFGMSVAIKRLGSLK
jgi:hypothetical protein